MKVTEIDMGWNAIVKELKKLDNKSIEVGIFEDAGEYTKSGKSISVASVANIQEHGATLKRKDKVIGSIPPRPFMKPSLEGVNLQRLMNLQKTLIGQLESKTPLSFSKVLKEVGETQQKLIQWIILRKSSPSNADSTIRQKGFDDPLMWSGRMQKSVKWKRKK